MYLLTLFEYINMIYYIVHVLCLILNPDTGNQNPDPNLRRNSEIDHNIFCKQIDHNILANKFFVRYIIIYVLFTEDKYIGI